MKLYWEERGYVGHPMYEEPVKAEFCYKTSDAWTEAYEQLTEEEQAAYQKRRQLRQERREAQRAERIRRYGPTTDERRNAGIKLQHQRRSRLEMITCPIWDKAVTAIPKEVRWEPQTCVSNYKTLETNMFLYSYM
jgi:hypothetical protein